MIAKNEKEEKGKVIEHLVWAHSSLEDVPGFKPSDPTQLEKFNIEPFLTFQVPASPKSEVLFIEFWAQVLYKWSDFETRRATLSCYLRIISDVIPNNIEVLVPKSVIDVGEKNFAGNYDLQYRRSRRNAKHRISRNGDIWGSWVLYKDSGEHVPTEIAQDIFNRLIDNGFNVEVYSDGRIQGCSVIWLIGVLIEVTRLSEN